MSESEGSDYEEADELTFGRLTETDVDRIRRQLSDKCSAVNAYLLSCREPVEKRRLVGSTLQDLTTAFNHIASAYLRVSASHQTASCIKESLKGSIKEEVVAALNQVLPSLPSSSPAGLSYANIASRSMKQDTHKVKITNGPTVNIPNTVSIVIGPNSAASQGFRSADETRKAVMKAIKPGEFDLKVNKVVNSRNNSVRIIAATVDVGKLKASAALTAAGLEIKEREKLNPRLVIRNVPTDLSNADLLADIVSMNLDGQQGDSIKVVYRYPSRLKNGLASVVIETSSELRRKFLTQGHIYLAWQSCRIEDHLRILQCFKCLGFGHLAKNCSTAAVCGNCAGAHETSSCAGDTIALKCNNCFLGKLPNSDHKAFDASKCPIIKRRLTEKAKYIAY